MRVGTDTIDSYKKCDCGGFMVKLEKGFYGSNCATLGAYNYRGFDIVVDDDMSMPNEGGEFAVGVYTASNGADGYMEDLIDIEYDSGFSLSKACKIVDKIIDWHLASKQRCQSVVNSGLEMEAINKCTCGAKHTSNPEFHMSWCDKK
jgi:hypothetical protein